MRVIRRLIALLLIVTLPAYGWAALALPETCPMQAAPAAQMTEANHACCEAADAANDESPQPGKSNPCKPGQQCKTGSFHPLQFPSAAQAPVTPDMIATVAETPVLSRDPAGIWRPPRIL